MPSGVPILAVADVGSSDGFHLGDEAMLEALIAHGRAGDHAIEWTIVSSDPQATAAALGVRAVPRLGFLPRDRGTAVGREALLARILSLADDPAGAPRLTEEAHIHAVLDALHECRGLVVAGGGNLNSLWPEHVYERVALITIAARLDLPVVVTGQSLGPALDEGERELLADSLGAAAFVGVRDAASRDLALTLGIDETKVRLGLDDAMFLASDGEDASAEIAARAGFDVAGTWIGVTVSRLGDSGIENDRLDDLATELEAIAGATGARLVLIPHVGIRDRPPRDDVRVAAELKRRIANRAPVSILPLLTPADTARLTRRASLVISTRYHPLVFGLSGAVPCLSIYLDEYTRSKCEGALRFAGLEGWAMHVGAARDGLLADAALELYGRRDEVRDHLLSCLPTWKAAAERHLESVLAALRASAPPGLPARDALPETLPGPTPGGTWAQIARAVRAAVAGVEAEFAGSALAAEDYALTLREQFEAAQEYAFSLRDALDEAQGEREKAS